MLWRGGEVLSQVLLGLEKEVLKIEPLPSFQLCWSMGVFLVHVGLPQGWPDYKSKGI